MWPRFSATRITAIGASISIACGSNTGARKLGTPNQAACPTIEKSIGLPSPIPLVTTA